MTLEDVARANYFAEQLSKIESFYELLARDITVKVTAPTGSFDGVTGRDYSSELLLAGQSRVELRRVIKYEYDRMAANLASLGVEVKELK